MGSERAAAPCRPLGQRGHAAAARGLTRALLRRQSLSRSHFFPEVFRSLWASGSGYSWIARGVRGFSTGPEPLRTETVAPASGMPPPLPPTCPLWRRHRLLRGQQSIQRYCLAFLPIDVFSKKRLQQSWKRTSARGRAATRPRRSPSPRQASLLSSPSLVPLVPHATVHACHAWLPDPGTPPWTPCLQSFHPRPLSLQVALSSGH